MSMALSAQVLPALAARTHAARGGRRASSVGKARAARHAIETRRSPSGWGALIPRVHTGGPEKKVEAPPAAASRLVVVNGTEDEVDAVTKKGSGRAVAAQLATRPHAPRWPLTEGRDGAKVMRAVLPDEIAPPPDAAEAAAPELRPRSAGT